MTRASGGLGLLVLALLAACVPKHHIASGAGMNIGAPLGTVADGPFRLLFGGPKGPSTIGADVTLAFSRAVSAAAEPASVVRDEDGRAVEGTWQWFGDSAAVFRPSSRFAAATTYRVEPQALTALDGSTVERGSIAPFTFTTERPKLERVSYEYDEKKDAHLVHVTFERDVSARAVNEGIRIEGRGASGAAATSVGFRVLAEPNGRGAHALTLQADAAIARLEDVAVVATIALRGTEGSLGPTTETRLPVEGVGPFKIEVECTPRKGRICADHASIHLALSSYVSERDLLHHFAIAAPDKANPEELKALLAHDADQQTDTLDLGALLAVTAGRKYRVTIKAGLRIGPKERLASDQVIDFETPNRPASLRWKDLRGAASVVESARASLPLALLATNVPSFDTVTAPLDEQQLADFLFPPEGKRDAAWVSALPKSVTATVKTAVATNEAAAETVRVAEGRAAGVAGAFLVGTRAPGLEDDVRLLSLTDLGVMTKWSPHGGLVWVTRLSTAEPVAGSTVSLRRVSPAGPHAAMTEVFATTTDHEGVATIPAAVAATFVRDEIDPSGPLLVVKQAADWTYTRLPELDQSLLTALGDVFVERGLYRPGETLLAKGYFRAPGPRGLVTLAGKTVYFEAVDSADHVFHAATATLDAFGSFSSEIAIPKDARLGSASLRARVGAAAPPPRPGGRWRSGIDRNWPAKDRFRIDAFRTPEFKVEARTDRASFVRGETVTLTATGTYLAGAPMTNVPVRVGVSRRPTQFTPPGLEGFAVSAGPFAESRNAASDLPTLDGKLDALGHATFRYPLPTSAATAPESYHLDVAVDDVSGAFSMGEVATVLVHPSDVYLGINADPGVPPLIPGKTVRAEMVIAGIDGTRRGGVAVRAELFRDSPKGDPSPTGRSCNVKVDSAKVASCDLGVTDEGQHWIKATALDASGRALVAATYFVVLPKNTKPPTSLRPAPPLPPLPARSFAEQCERPGTGSGWFPGVTLENRWTEPYLLGAEALVCLHAAEATPRNARGLLTLEREGVLRRDPLIDFRTAGWKVAKVPLTDDLFPNADVALVEAIGRVAPFPRPGGGDSGYPRGNSRSETMTVAAPAKKLSVTIETEKEARPGTEIELHLRVNDGEGRPAAAQVTLWAIDEGIHLLMPRLPPMPEHVFGAQRSVDVLTTDTRSSVFFERGGMHDVKAPSIRQGATSLSERTLLGRSVFKPTAFFLPNILTNANGTTTVRAKLPHNLTTWKVFAVAATATDAFGEGETFFTTSKPLMARPQLPRFLRVGDRFDATVMIDSLLKEPVDVTLSIRAAGVLAAKTTSVRATIPPEGHVPLHALVEATAVGSGKLVFDVTSTRGPAFHDEVTIEEEVASLASIETVVVAGEIPKSSVPAIVNEPLGDLRKVRPDVGGFDYRLSTTPLVGLAASLNGLIEYPYGCTEQLTSRLVPLIRLREMAKDLAVALPPNVDAAVRSSLASLLSHQQSDGGFGVWRESRASEAWLTLLALGALQAAEQHGYVVPASSVDQARKWLESSTANPANLDAGSRAMREDLLASMGKPRAAELRVLATDATLPLFAQALTAHALATVDRDLANQLLSRITTQAHVSGAVVTFADEPTLDSRRHLSSNARTTAMVLRALLAIERGHPLVTKTVRGLLSLRRDGRWQTTQDSAWALAALEDARALYRPPAGRTTAEFLFAHDTVTKLSFSGLPGGETRTGTIAMSRLLTAPGASASFESDGERPLYYEAALRYARSEPPLSPLDHGLTVARSLRPLAATAVSSSSNARDARHTPFHIGEYVVADVLIVTITPRDLVVLADPIPAGFEAVNASFASMDHLPLVVDPAQSLTHRELHDDRVVSFFDSLPAGVEHTRYVLRAITAGHFALPPATAECMYAPDVFGRTSSTTIEIH